MKGENDMGNIFEDMISMQLNPEQGELVTEATYVDNISYLKTLPKSILLPQGSPPGRGNLCFLYSKSIDDSIEFMKNPKNCLPKHYYNYYYYNLYYQGRLLKRIIEFVI